NAAEDAPEGPGRRVDAVVQVAVGSSTPEVDVGRRSIAGIGGDQIAGIGSDAGIDVTGAGIGDVGAAADGGAETGVRGGGARRGASIAGTAGAHGDAPEGAI